jgi:hypothetical protein
MPAEVLQNHLGTLITTKQHTRFFFGVWKLALVISIALFFWVFDPPRLWGAVTFSILFYFW